MGNAGEQVEKGEHVETLAQGRRCRRNAQAPKVISSYEGAGANKTIKKILLYISAVKTIGAILPKDR